MRIKRFIEIVGSLRAAKYILAGSTVTLFTGSIYYNISNEIFIPLNRMGMFRWMSTYGFENPLYTWWFFLFVVLMVVLGLNTLFCTLDRLVKIIGRFKDIRKFKTKLYLLAPHIMHFSFMVLMIGYFSLYAFGINTYDNILRKGIPSLLPGTDVKIELKEHRFTPYNSDTNAILKGKYLAAEFDLLFSDNESEVIKTAGCNAPCYYRGYSIHVAEFNPKSARYMTKTVWVNLTIRKNVGIPLFLTGVIIFVIGVFLYAASSIETGRTMFKTNKEMNYS
jgi:hypothetical protein